MPRGIWKGSLSFGLVSIGVELYNCEAPERIDLDLLDRRDMSHIGYLKVNKTTGEPVDAADIVRGYAVKPGRYVVLSDADLRSANPRATRTIDVLGFLAADAIPLFYFARPYALAPSLGSEKAYALLREALLHTRRLALATMVLRTRQYLVAVYPFQRALIAQMLRYDEEVRKPDDLGIGAAPAADRALRPAEVALAKKVIDEMVIEWKPARYRDEYRDDLLRLAKRRAAGAKPEHRAPPPAEPRVINLMDALKRSVGHRGAGSSRRRRTTAGHTRRSA